MATLGNKVLAGKKERTILECCVWRTAHSVFAIENIGCNQQICSAPPLILSNPPAGLTTLLRRRYYPGTSKAFVPDLPYKPDGDRQVVRTGDSPSIPSGGLVHATFTEKSLGFWLGTHT